MRKAVVHFCGDVNISIARIHMGDRVCSTRVSPKNKNVKFHSFHPLKHNHFAYNATTKSFKILSHVLLSELGANVSIGEYKGKKWQNINFRGFSYLRLNLISRKKYLISNLTTYFHFLTECGART